MKNVQVDTEEVKGMQELMKTWSNKAPIKLTIKEKISKLNQMNTGGEESFESWKAARLAGGRKRKADEGTNVGFEGSKRANVMANTETELETNLGKENINLKSKITNINDFTPLASSTRDGGEHVRAGAAGIHGEVRYCVQGARAKISTCLETRLGENFCEVEKASRQELVPGRK